MIFDLQNGDNGQTKIHRENKSSSWIHRAKQDFMKCVLGFSVQVRH